MSPPCKRKKEGSSGGGGTIRMSFLSHKNRENVRTPKGVGPNIFPRVENRVQTQGSRSDEKSCARKNCPALVRGQLYGTT